MHTGEVGVEKHSYKPDFCSSSEYNDPVSRTDVRTYDISELYQFADQTGILERHRQMLSQPFQDSQVNLLTSLLIVERAFLVFGLDKFLSHSLFSSERIPKRL